MQTRFSNMFEDTSDELREDDYCDKCDYVCGTL